MPSILKKYNLHESENSANLELNNDINGDCRKIVIQLDSGKVSIRGKIHKNCDPVGVVAKHIALIPKNNSGDSDFSNLPHTCENWLSDGNLNYTGVYEIQLPDIYSSLIFETDSESRFSVKLCY